LFHQSEVANCRGCSEKLNLLYCTPYQLGSFKATFKIHFGGYTICQVSKEYSENRFNIEETIGFKGKGVHTLTGRLKEYEIKATSDIQHTLFDTGIDIKTMNKSKPHI
jgi:hypothetical protein